MRSLRRTERTAGGRRPAEGPSSYDARRAAPCSDGTLRCRHSRTMESPKGTVTVSYTTTCTIFYIPMVLLKQYTMVYACADSLTALKYKVTFITLLFILITLGIYLIICYCFFAATKLNLKNGLQF